MTLNNTPNTGTSLQPMPLERFAAYMQHSVTAYAQENVAAKRWLVGGALERAQADFQALLPLGLATPNHYLFEVVRQIDDCVVGWLWFAVEERVGQRDAYVYDLEIKPVHQRQGHAKLAFQHMEALVREMGLQRIGLHVFAHNAGAQKLYERLGYSTTGMNMAKLI